MKRNKQKPDFLHIGEKLLTWYKINGRNLPWRNTKQPYNIWICEIILQQTQVRQGLNHYLNFVNRFPNVKTLAEANTDEVLLYWKGLGYYSRALNLHEAARQIIDDFNGKFPSEYHEILKLKGVGKYTAAAISSICFEERVAAVDGNFYRVLSRLFADGFNVSQSSAFQYFTELALQMMPRHSAGDFNQAMMDLGSEICKPKNPNCDICPLKNDCLAFSVGNVQNFPVKLKKVKTTDLFLHYFFVEFEDKFLIKQRSDRFIWKKLYEFPTELPKKFQNYIIKSTTLQHKLTHKNLTIQIDNVKLDSDKEFESFAEEHQFKTVTFSESNNKSFPRPLESFLEKWAQKSV